MLSPTLALRGWSQLSAEEKRKIWHYLKSWFRGEGSDLTVILSIINFNDLHKFHSYAGFTLENSTIDNAHMDFENIFLNQPEENVVLELLSCFGLALLEARSDTSSSRIYRSEYKSDEEYNKDITEWRYKVFDRFARELNDVFENFGVNIVLTRSQFVARQDPKIVNEIYIPVLSFLSLPKWKDAEREMRDAFKKYQDKTEQGYSSCITHAISGLEAFLQVLIDGKTGSSAGLAALITQARGKGVLPTDKFSQEVVRGLGDAFLRDRGKMGDGHPKKEYANEKNARLVLNLAMVFMQHCLQESSTTA